MWYGYGVNEKTRRQSLNSEIPPPSSSIQSPHRALFLVCPFVLGRTGIPLRAKLHCCSRLRFCCVRRKRGIKRFGVLPSVTIRHLQGRMVKNPWNKCEQLENQSTFYLSRIFFLLYFLRFAQFPRFSPNSLSSSSASGSATSRAVGFILRARIAMR